MRKVWYAFEEEEGIVAFLEVPLIFLNRRETIEPVEKDGIFGGCYNVCQLRWWARAYLWLKKTCLIKVW